MKFMIWSVVVSVFVVLAGLGCGSQREMGQVEGQVSIDGKPAEKVQVTFHPDSSMGNEGDSAMGVTDAEGRYRLETPSMRREGAVIGPHRVVFIDLTVVPNRLQKKAGAPSDPDLPMVAGKKSRRFPVFYGQATDTPFRDVQVKPGTQTLDFDLKSKAKQ